MFVSTVYGQAYEPAGGILMVHAWAGLFVFLGVARSQWLVVEGMTRFTLLATILGAVVNLLLNLVLIPPFGGLGAAFATVVSYAVSAVGTSFLLPATRRIGFMQLRAMALPVTVLARRRVSVS
ncbi:MAG: hypothetical protein D6781_09675 [Verrucomicrobia bacterium]|nr:MAG: hypothetical protein D6781_09675 [Verrucomicrobiota bacterium]